MGAARIARSAPARGKPGWASQRPARAVSCHVGRICPRVPARVNVPSDERTTTQLERKNGQKMPNALHALSARSFERDAKLLLRLFSALVTRLGNTPRRADAGECDRLEGTRGETRRALPLLRRRDAASSSPRGDSPRGLRGLRRRCLFRARPSCVPMEPTSASRKRARTRRSCRFRPVGS